MAESLHRLVVGHPRQWRREIDSQMCFREPFHQAIDHADHVVGIDERHLDVELCEFRLAIRAQIFIAKATRHLHVTVVASDHENLFVQLRRLRQRVELAAMHATGDKIVARPLGRAPTKHGRFDIDEIVLGKIIAHVFDERRAQ